MRAAFELARHNAPSVVFVDEAEAVLGGGRDRVTATTTATAAKGRGGGGGGGGSVEHEASRRHVFLKQLLTEACNFRLD